MIALRSYLSYYVESLFNSVLASKTTVYSLKRIDIDKQLKPFCNKSSLKKLLIKFIMRGGGGGSYNIRGGGGDAWTRSNDKISNFNLALSAFLLM